MTEPRSVPDYEAIIAGCKAGRPQAMRELYDCESGRMLGVAVRIVRDPALAEDVVHEAFVSVWRHAATFDPSRGSGRTWIYSILRNAALSAVRRRATQPATLPVSGDEDGESVVDTLEDPRAQVMLETRPDMGRLHACLQALDDHRRECVLLSYVEGCSHSEIADRLGAPLGTVKSWIKRALLALRDCMS